MMRSIDSVVKRAHWRQALVEALWITLLLLGILYYWFGIADRYAIFLYEHQVEGLDSGQPFAPITISRYWMTGFVAGGFVMVLYIAWQWIRGRLAHWRKQPLAVPDWWQVWLLSALPIGVGVVLITMTVNSPTLPLPLALTCVMTTWLGLAGALLPGRWAATKPRELLWLAVDSCGLFPPLLLLHVIELPGQGASFSSATAWRIIAITTVLGLLWLLGISLLRRWRRIAIPSMWALLAAGCVLSYLGIPLLHHLLLTPPEYHYISNGSNFFADNPLVQSAAVGVAALIALGVTKFRYWLQRRRKSNA